MITNFQEMEYLEHMHLAEINIQKAQQHIDEAEVHLTAMRTAMIRHVKTMPVANAP